MSYKDCLVVEVHKLDVSYQAHIRGGLGIKGILKVCSADNGWKWIMVHSEGMVENSFSSEERIDATKHTFTAKWDGCRLCRGLGGLGWTKGVGGLCLLPQAEEVGNVGECNCRK